MSVFPQYTLGDVRDMTGDELVDVAARAWFVWNRREEIEGVKTR